MGYRVRVQRGKKIRYGKRVYRKKARAKKSINSRRGQAFLKRHNIKKTRVVKARKLMRLKKPYGKRVYRKKARKPMRLTKHKRRSNSCTRRSFLKFRFR